MEQNVTPPVKNNISFWKKMKIVLATILALTIALLIFQNWNSIQIDFILKQFSLPLPLIIFFSLLTGYLWGTFSSYRKVKQKDAEIKSLKQNS